MWSGAFFLNINCDFTVIFVFTHLNKIQLEELLLHIHAPEVAMSIQRFRQSIIYIFPRGCKVHEWLEIYKALLETL